MAQPRLATGRDRARRLRQGATRGSAAAALRYAEALAPAAGSGELEPNAHAALRWLRRAFARGEARAEALLGYLLFHGWGAEASRDGDRRLWRAASRGSASALAYLIESLEMIGPKRAEHEALCHLCARAGRALGGLPPQERGRERARLRALAEEALARGRGSGEKHRRWLRYAALLGHPEARRRLGEEAKA